MNDGCGRDGLGCERLPLNHYGLEGVRDYASGLGRWIAKDGEDTNLYAHVKNDPINWLDQEGYFPWAATAVFGICEAKPMADALVTDWQMGQQLDQINSLKLQKKRLEEVMAKALDCESNVNPKVEQLYSEVSADLLARTRDYARYKVSTDLAAETILCAALSFGSEKALPTLLKLLK